MAVKQKPSGRWQCDVKKAGADRFRATFDTREEALKAETDYLGSVNISRKQVTVVTFRNLFDMTKQEKWYQEVSSPRRFAKWQIEHYWGWDKDVNTIRTRDVTEFKRWLKEEGANSQATVNRKVSALSVMFKIGLENELVDEPPLCKQGKVKNNSRMRLIEPKERHAICEFVEATRGVHWRMYFEVLAETGCRINELFNLKWVDVTPNLLRLWDTKGGVRQAPLTPKASDVLEKLRGVSSGDRVFPFKDTTLHKTIWPDIRKKFQDFDKDFVPHAFRHTRATRLVEAGLDIEVIRQWMGHKTIATTMLYVKFNPERFAAALDKLEAHEEL